MAAQPVPSCRSWRCFIQDNFTSVALFLLLIVSIGLTVVLMHEDKIDDKYVVWMEGFTAGIFSAWTLSLKSATTGQHQGDTIKTGDNTVVNNTPLAAPVPEVAPLENPAPETPRPDLPVFADQGKS